MILQPQYFYISKISAFGLFPTPLTFTEQI